MARRDLSAEWWTLFRSPALNALVQQSLNYNPSLQTAMGKSAGGTAAGVCARGQILSDGRPQFQSDEPTDSERAYAGSQLAANPFTLYKAQLGVSYTFDVWGLNRRTVEVSRVPAG